MSTTWPRWRRDGIPRTMLIWSARETGGAWVAERSWSNRDESLTAGRIHDRGEALGDHFRMVGQVCDPLVEPHFGGAGFDAPLRAVIPFQHQGRRTPACGVRRIADRQVRRVRVEGFGGSGIDAHHLASAQMPSVSEHAAEPVRTRRRNGRRHIHPGEPATPRQRASTFPASRPPSGRPLTLRCKAA